MSRVLRNITYFLTGSVLAKALGAAQMFLLARYLGPADYGVWITLLLMISYGPILCLGTVETLVKRVPQFQARGEKGKLSSLESAVFSSVLLAGGIWFLLSQAIIPLVSSETADGRFALVVMAFAVGMSFITAFFQSRFNAYEDFKSVGMAESVRATTALLLVVTGCFLFGLRGAALGYLGQEIMMACWTGWRSFSRQGAIKPGLDFSGMVVAVKEGFPISLSWWMFIVQNSIDRAVLGAMLSVEIVGYYGLGISLTNLFSLVPTIVGRVLYPRVNHQMHSGASDSEVANFLLRSTRALAVFLALLQAVLLIAMPLLYNVLLPKYRPGLVAGEILLFGFVSPCLVRTAANFLVARHLQGAFFRSVLLSLGLNVGLNVGLVWLGFGLVGVAIGSSISSALLCVLVWYRTLQELGFRPLEIWKRVGALYFPTGILGLGALLTNIFLSPILLVFDWSSVLLGIVLLVSIGMALGCSREYRGEFGRWKELLRGRLWLGRAT